VIVAITGVTAGLLVVLSWLALDPPSLKKAVRPIESEEPARNGGADALADVPRTYGDVPRLGPPLPGDLGRPILEHERGLDVMPPRSPPADDAARSAAEQRRQELEAARSSPVIADLPRSAASAIPLAQASTPAAPAVGSDATGPASSSVQQHKMEFAGSSNAELNPDVVHAAPSPWTLSAGTLIPASLVTGLNSDLPGTVIAQVTQNVRDSATGQTVLVPQGTRLIGRYDSMVSYGQRRALLVWARMIFADGSSVRLDNMPGTDSSGYAGLEDSVDSHTWTLLKGVALATLLGVGTELSLGSSESDLVHAIRESAQENVAHAGDQITSRNLEVQPTIKVRPGWPVRVIVNKDLVLQPWRG
jgi:type IV secretion system protein VirB10